MSDTGWGRKEAGAPAQGTKRDGGEGEADGTGLAWPRDTACVRRLDCLVTRWRHYTLTDHHYKHQSPIVSPSPGSKTRVGLDLLHCAVHTGG